MKDEPCPRGLEPQSEKNTNKKTPLNANWFERLVQAFGSSQPQNIEQLLVVLRDAQERQLFDHHAMNMIEGAFEVAEMRVREIMIPRSQMTVVEKDASFEEILQLVTGSGHSRFPVIGEDKDELEGVLLAKDLLKYATRQEAFSIDDVIRDVVIIPESKRLNTLLNEFRASRNHMALVVDEYGGVSGLVTIEDVLEVIVGDIDDEHDVEEASNIMAHRKGHYNVNALTEIEEFNEHFNASLSSEESDTIGGFVMKKLGHVPKRGEQVWAQGFLFTVLGADSRRIYRLKVTKSERALI